MKNIKFFFFLLVFFSSTFCSSDENKVYYVVHDDDYHHGMFSCFCTVIGLLDYYENGHCAGFEVNYKNHGFYYDASKGTNWWTYYFEPLVVGNSPDLQKEPLPEGLHNGLAIATYFDIPLSRSAELVQKYIQVKPKINEKINEFVFENFKNKYIIGVHYRGTDKFCEAPKVSFEVIVHEIQEAIKSCKKSKYAIFVATDEQAFLDKLQNQFPGQILCIDALRSTTGKPIHLHHENYKKGLDAVMDCLLLSRCHFLIRTSSSLSLCSTFFNPHLPVLLVNPGVYDKVK